MHDVIGIDSFSARNANQDDTWRIGKGAGALAFVAAIAVIRLVTIRIGGNPCECAFTCTRSISQVQLSVRRGERDGKTGMLVVSVFSIPRKRRRRRVSLLPATNSSQCGWSVKVENTLAEFQRSREGPLLASVTQAETTLAGMHSNGALAVLAPVNLNERVSDISVLEEDRNGCMLSLQRFLHQLEGRVRHVPVCSTSRRKSEQWENEANCF